MKNLNFWVQKWARGAFEECTAQILAQNLAKYEAI